MRYYFVVFVAKQDSVAPAPGTAALAELLKGLDLGKVSSNSVTANCYVACDGPLLVRGFKAFYNDGKEEFKDICVTFFQEIDEETFLVNTVEKE